MRVWLLLLLASGILAGCSTVTHDGGKPQLDPSAVRIFLPQVANATEDEHAGRAMTEIMASVLFKRGLPVVQVEEALQRTRVENAAGADGLFRDMAKSVNATHLLIGTVHEYRYKTDLDGDPAVGISLRLVDVSDGQTLWQGSSSRVSVFFASLTTAAQRAVHDLVERLPIARGSASLAAKSK